MSDKAQKARVPLWVKLLLGVSLALNLAVLGLLGGIAMRISDPDRGPMAISYALPYVIALPRGERRSIGQTLRRTTREGGLPARQERGRHYREMLALLDAETWDEAQARVILGKQFEDTQAVQMAAQSAWLAQMARFSAAERRAYAARLREVLERGGKRRSKKPD